MARAKKKTPHWTRLPRPKLIARAKRLEQLLDRCKVQLAEMRETKLLNRLDERATVEGARVSEHSGVCTAPHAPNATTSAALEELTRNESVFPWERTEGD